MNGTAEYALLSVTNPTMTTMPNTPAVWGPHHQSDVFTSSRSAGGGYWWTIAAGTVLACFSTLANHDTLAIAVLTLVLSAAAAAVGSYEARLNRQFASGHWLLFAIAALASSTVFFVPALAYTVGFLGRQRVADHARHAFRGLAAAATPIRTLGAPSTAFAPHGSTPRSSVRQHRKPAPRTTTPHPARRKSLAPQLPPKKTVPVVAGGFFGTNTSGVVSASARGAALVIGPPGSGKTQSVIMPSVAFAPGAVVSTSMKAEVLAATHVARSRQGTCWLFDPGGTSVPAGVSQLRWNPLCDVTDWDSARSVASRLSGPARPGAGAGHEGDHWTDRAETWLSVLLYAAKLSTSEGDIKALARWCLNPTDSGPHCEAILTVAEQDGDDDAAIANALLNSLLSVPDRERESIASTLGRIMNIYTSSAAIRSGIDPNFDVHSFVRSSDTVYITAPVDRQRDYAPLIAGFLESIRLAQYHRRQAVDLGHESQTAPVTFVLDEAANTAPIPLPNVVSEAGGQGLHLVVAFQDLSQARARWGQAADGFLTLFPDKLVLSGMNDRQTSEMLSRISGDYDRMTVSVSRSGTSINTSTAAGRPQLSFGRARPSYSHHTTRTPVLSVADIVGVPAGRGLHFSPRGWELLTLNPWWHQRQLLGV